jgi:hypothetical protein
MRTPVLLALLAVVLAAPAAALADTGSPTPASTAAQTCKQERTAMGVSVFAQTYGTNGNKANAFGKCVSSHAKSATAQDANAAQTCKAQQADPNFSASHGGKTFAQFYGTNSSSGKGSDKNAFGKCVSMAVAQSGAAEAKVETGAAKTCKAARTADPAAFAGKWGTAKNAFGKCVSATAKTP